MITKCQFCDFQRETPLPNNILELMANEDLATEDLILWFQRMIASIDTKGNAGVKIHMGRMHKKQAYYGMWPFSEYTDDEMRLIRKIADKFEEHHAFNGLLQAGTLKKRPPDNINDDNMVWL